MSYYKYHGRVTGFSESDAVTVWQPIENPYPVQHGQPHGPGLVWQPFQRPQLPGLHLVYPNPHR